MHEDKTYETVIRLGWESSTLDCSGEITKIGDVNIPKNIIEQTLESFKGNYKHRVPDLSAKKFKGKTFYSLKFTSRILKKTRYGFSFKTSITTRPSNFKQPALKKLATGAFNEDTTSSSPLGRE